MCNLFTMTQHAIMLYGCFSDHCVCRCCSVVDAEGNAVSVTTTINTGFGSIVVSKSTGLLLNNEMDGGSLASDVM